MILFAQILLFHAAFCCAVVWSAVRWRRDPDPSGAAWGDLKIATWLAGLTGVGISVCLIGGLAMAFLPMLANGESMMKVLMLMVVFLAIAAALPVLGLSADVRGRTKMIVALASLSGLATGAASVIVFLASR